MSKFFFFTNDCRSSHESVVLVKFSDDTTVSGLISDCDESKYREEVEAMVSWCSENNLILNVSKTKEIIVDFRSKRTEISTLSINDQEVEIVDSFKFLGCTISNDLTWDNHVFAVRKKAQQRLFFLRQLKKFRINETILVQFYRSIIESILTFSMTTWFGSTTQQNRDDLQRVVKCASKIIGCEVPSLQSLYDDRLIRKAKSILKDETHPAHHIFQPLPSGKRYRTIYAKTERARSTFFYRAVKAVSM